MRLVDPTGGQVLVNGRISLHSAGNDLKAYRRQMQIVFQDSYSALDPMMTLARRSSPSRCISTA